MKKQILTLSMCLALTATAALAAGTNPIVNSVSSKTKIAVPVKDSAKVRPTNVAAPSAQEQPKFMSRDEAKKAFDARKAKERELLYTALELTAEQKAKAEALDVKTRKNIEPLFRTLQVEARKFRALRAKKASAFSLWRQKLAVKSAKANVDKYLAKSKKEFEAILTPAQKTKFETIDAAKKEEMQKMKNQYKMGPSKMGPKPPEGVGPEHMGPPHTGMGKNGFRGQEPAGTTHPDNK